MGVLHLGRQTESERIPYPQKSCVKTNLASFLRQLPTPNYYESASPKVPWCGAKFLVIFDHALLDEARALPVAEKASEFVLLERGTAAVCLSGSQAALASAA